MGPRAVFLASAIAVASVRSDVAAQPITLVVVTSAEPNAVFAEVAAGVVMPCDSSANQPLARTRIVPGQTLTLASPRNCICWRRTREDSPTADWSESQISCKSGRICRGRACWPDPDPALRLRLR